MENLLVTRDGSLDNEYYDAIYAERRREVMHTAMRGLIKTPLVIGKGIVWLFMHEGN